MPLFACTSPPRGALNYAAHAAIIVPADPFVKAQSIKRGCCAAMTAARRSPRCTPCALASPSENECVSPLFLIPPELMYTECYEFSTRVSAALLCVTLLIHCGFLEYFQKQFPPLAMIKMHSVINGFPALSCRISISAPTLDSDIGLVRQN